MRTWPSELPPAPTPDSWTETPQPNTLGFQPDVGRRTTRRRATASGSNCQATFVMTDEQLEIFQEWWEFDLQDGTMPFLFAHPKRLVSFMFTFDEPYQAQSISRDANRVAVKMTREP
jgi:hypothetical protein